MVLNNNPNNINLSRIKRDTHSCDDIVDHCNNNGSNDNNINQIRNPYAKISLEKLNSSRNCFVLGANNTPSPPSLPPPLPGPPPALPTVSRKISIKKCKFFFVTLPKNLQKGLYIVIWYYFSISSYNLAAHLSNRVIIPIQSFMANITIESSQFAME